MSQHRLVRRHPPDQHPGGDKLRFSLPESGRTLWSDNFLLPTATNKAGAEALIDYLGVAAWVDRD